jgi:hypothetical protein
MRSEYALLFVASVFALNIFETPIYFAAYVLVFVASLALLLFRTTRKPEQDWYKCRALAESVRTSTWRYVMRAEPFNSDDLHQAHAALRNYLSEVLKSNRHIGDKIAGFNADGEQTTVAMDSIRKESLADRRDYYVTNRIRQQRTWYSHKAAWNKRMANIWTIACVITYSFAIALVLARIGYPTWKIWPIGPLVVLASAIIGWMQIKKFNELSSAYTLTAHEIRLTQGKLEDVRTEEELSEFVNEAELVFSREHTQWVARQNT